ncbi:MAG: 1-(5-phosphoribosyl)-5-((5-phosphoribosylamino)methylideneamino)imidazole-4-carboxamide isomerase [Candidatus Eremiobacteraeota bacterium]|jgi:phosphoribosylformimino-5-aminoimidazole carboxamide ribotide isomerase|nr:1-(5-phosphoribosyl)-5-((5-phosphoribosylamino)methylideneamino)imidazole-4-carboxamide isomerase [Candidatus Eremiobacteraeota bacterium]
MRELTLLPAIDLRGGYAVRLERGDPTRETRYDADPVARARAFVADGATALHVVDLDGAFGTGENQSALRAICAAVDVPVQTGGGVRSREDVAARLDAGAHAIVIGTLLVERPDDVRLLVDVYGDRIVAGIDARGDRVATRGWLDETMTSRDELVRRVAGWGVGRIVYTEIARDGMGSGYDVDALAHVAAVADVQVTASGGARTIDDLIALRDGTPANVNAAIVGRALYEGTLDLRAALERLAG